MSMIKQLLAQRCLARLTLALALVSTLIAVSAPQSAAGGRPAQPAVVDGPPWRVYLPLISNGEGVPSPFSLQIAALHLVQPNVTGVGSASVAPLTEAEWNTLYGASFITLTQALRESGAGWSRVYINWSWIEPVTPTAGVPPAYVWGPYHDDKLRLVAEAGVQLIGTVTYAPAWAASTPCAPIYPERLGDFAQFLTDLVNHYKQPPYSIRYWELINEPDGVGANLGAGGLGCWGTSGAAYAQMLAVAYPAIKAADPGATVLMGGVAHDWFQEYGGPFYRYFPDDVMAAGGGQYMDTLSFHYFPDYHAEWERWDPNSQDRQYGWLPAPTCGNLFDGLGQTYAAGGIDVIAKTSHFRNRMAACFGVVKPIWITELAEHGYPGDEASLTNQARYVIMGQARALAAGVVNITWYSLDHPPYDSYEQSLLYADFSPKPAFYAYKTLTAELRGYQYARTLSVTGGEGYVFSTKRGQEKTVAWGSGALTLSPAGQVRVVDRLGNVSFVTDGGPGDADGAPNGAVRVSLSADPAFIQIVN